MKTKKFKSKQLLKLHLLKSRVYEHSIKKTNFNDLIDTNLDQILVGVKKALQVIFQYNQMNKRILFIGLPPKFELKINSLTQHIAVSSSFNIHGLISNNNVNLLSRKRSTFPSLKLMKKPDLIVLFEHEKGNSVVSESWVAKIPVINFITSNDSTELFINNLYSVNGNFKNILVTFDKNILFVGLNFLFKSLKKKKIRSSSVIQKPSSSSPFFNKDRQKSRLKKQI